MSENFDVKVQIREELKIGLVFGFGARLPIATFLSYVGYHDEVLELMQVLSHGTRAYISNSDGLKNFLIVNKEIWYILRKADKKGELEYAKRW